MRSLLLFTLLFLALQTRLVNAAPPEWSHYFSMEVKGWLDLSARDQFGGINQMLAATGKKITQEQVKAVVSCMKTVGESALWNSADAGTLMVKCGYDMAAFEPVVDAELTLVIDCIKNNIPDFSAEEFLSVGLSMVGAELAKDSGAQPALTPRTKKIMMAIGSCQK